VLRAGAPQAGRRNQAGVLYTAPRPTPTVRVPARAGQSRGVWQQTASHLAHHAATAVRRDQQCCRWSALWNRKISVSPAPGGVPSAATRSEVIGPTELARGKGCSLACPAVPALLLRFQELKYYQQGLDTCCSENAAFVVKMRFCVRASPSCPSTTPGAQYCRGAHPVCRGERAPGCSAASPGCHAPAGRRSGSGPSADGSAW
jgi:hypothetical protein